MKLSRPSVKSGMSVLLALLPSGAQAQQSSDAVTELGKVVTIASPLERSGDLMPNARTIPELFGTEISLRELPRSVTVLSPETLRQFGIRSFADLGRIGAGTQQVNYYGVAALPTLRGAKGSVYYNGMQRAYQRNEMPLSFGSAEAMDVVKGPAPAHFGPGMVGGFVNLMPKSPSFGDSRQALQLMVGNDDLYQVQADVSGTAPLFGKAVAARASITAQVAGSPYSRIRNDFLSTYIALKGTLSPALSFFSCAEFFHYKTNENAGWNRPTQELVDSGRYVIGEPVNVSSPAWGGYADRNAISASPALVVPSSIVETGVSSGFISSEQRSLLNNLATPEGRLAAYGASSPYLENQKEGYQYTPAYFAAGGRVFTAPLSTYQVLSDSSDYADSQNLLWYLEFKSQALPALPVRSQLLLDWVVTNKLSSYGYAASTRQLVLEEKLSIDRSFQFLGRLNLRTGVSVRYTGGKLLQDYTLEPFGRRDITRQDISPNTVILTGPQTGPDGLNFWSPTSQGGANISSNLWQFSAFAHAEHRLLPWLTTHLSFLAAHAPFRTHNPSEVDRATPAQDAALATRGNKNYANLSFSPVVSLLESVSAYATVQRGTSLDATQGGAVFGEGNFARNDLDEVGLKAELWKRRVFSSLSLFRWEQSQFDTRTLSPELLKGRGLEFELSARLSAPLTLIASAGWQRVRRLKPLPFRSMPLSEQQWALYGGVLNSQFGPAYFNPAEGRSPAANPDLVYPGFPETQYKLFLHLQLPGRFSIAGGPVISSAFWHNFDHSIRLPSSTVWNGTLSWDHPLLRLRLEIENLFNEAYYFGAEPVFGANTLVTKAPGLQWKLSASLHF